MKTFSFIDASNLFYGGKKSLGWRIDYKKLLDYLRSKYGVEKAFYFGGIELHNFPYDYLKNDTVPVEVIERYLNNLIKEKGGQMDETKLVLISRHLQRTRFYKKLQQFGYILYLKPIKFYEQENGTPKRKANCDVDMAFHLMKEKDNFDRIVVLSGDGDFLPVLKYLKAQNKKVIVLARGSRTAKEIRQFAGGNFRDFEYLKFILKMDEK